VRGIIVNSRDVTERARAEEALRASEARLALQYAATVVLSASATLDTAIPQLLQAVGERTDWVVGAFWRVDADGVTLRCAHTWHTPSDALGGFTKVSRRTRFARGEGLPGSVWASGAPAWLLDVATDANFPRAAAATVAEVRAAVAVPIVAAGAVYGVMEFFSRDTQPPRADVLQAVAMIGTHIGQFTERVQAEEAVRHQATHDALTDLPNRVLLHARVTAALDDAPDDAGPLALLLLDLDHFKEVNDTFGHERGDALLQEVAARLRGVVRVSDTVARLGGDEFAVLLPGMDAAGAGRVAEAICATLDAPLRVEEQMLRVGASVGIALGPVHGVDGPTLLRRADVAMYAAKRARTGHAVYDPAQDGHSPERLALIGELRTAIERGALALHYQPQVDLTSGRVCGVEALVRWPHPERGLIPPDRFISLAEQTGLIEPLTQWVLAEAVRQCREWQRTGVLLTVSVNLSMWNLHDPVLPERVAGLLREHGVSPAWLRLELTESALMADPGRALDVLTRLAGLGVRLAVDDFGVGYSSLAYLKTLPVDELKIDKGFVRAMATDTADAAIVASTVELGHALGLRVVAEGIEDRVTWDALAEMGCDVAQGYYLSRPLAPDALAGWLRESPWAVA
jgi:diguanylate cyclase (GGDEF)-like protein